MLLVRKARSGEPVLPLAMFCSSSTAASPPGVCNRTDSHGPDPTNILAMTSPPPEPSHGRRAPIAYEERGATLPESVQPEATPTLLQSPSRAQACVAMRYTAESSLESSEDFDLMRLQVVMHRNKTRSSVT
ncbi:MAG: hypothetical protein SGPRY_001273 [Prymnesium sp.]